jgi:hypothetical protein
MELALFIGIQATGKSSFYKERFYRTHVRVNYDMVKTRDREAILGPSSRLEPPSRGEGFDRLFFVRLNEPNGLTVEEWKE